MSACCRPGASTNGPNASLEESGAGVGAWRWNGPGIRGYPSPLPWKPSKSSPLIAPIARARATRLSSLRSLLRCRRRSSSSAPARARSCSCVGERPSIVDRSSGAASASSVVDDMVRGLLPSRNLRFPLVLRSSLFTGTPGPSASSGGSWIAGRPNKSHPKKVMRFCVAGRFDLRDPPPARVAVPRLEWRECVSAPVSVSGTSARRPSSSSGRARAIR